MSIRFGSLLVAVLLVLNGCGHTTYYLQEGVSNQQSAKDFYECKLASMHNYTAGSVLSTPGVATSGMIVSGTEPDETLTGDCMRARGYTLMNEEQHNAQEAERVRSAVATTPTSFPKEARVRPPSAPSQIGREITGQDGAPMLLVPAGEFLYGDNNQRLSLPAFYMDKYELATSLYAQFLQATNREKPQYWNHVSLASDGSRPVVGVTWHDADAYCRQYGKRLPTEQEWEKAARGTDGRKYPWGNEEPNPSLASYDWDGNGKRPWQGYATLATVKSYEAGKSPYGIYNMAGNVWEWTSSDYEGSNKILRGGASFNLAIHLRSSLRNASTPTRRSNSVGFRCVQDDSR